MFLPEWTYTSRDRLPFSYAGHESSVVPEKGERYLNGVFDLIRFLRNSFQVAAEEKKLVEWQRAVSKTLHDTPQLREGKKLQEYKPEDTEEALRTLREEFSSLFSQSDTSLLEQNDETRIDTDFIQFLKDTAERYGLKNHEKEEYLIFAGRQALRLQLLSNPHLTHTTLTRLQTSLQRFMQDTLSTGSNFRPGAFLGRDFLAGLSLLVNFIQPAANIQRNTKK